MNPAIRHRYEPDLTEVTVDPHKRCVCGQAKTNRIHRLGSRCSVCFTYHKHYELDSSRRCDECRP